MNKEKLLSLLKDALWILTFYALIFAIVIANLDKIRADEHENLFKDSPVSIVNFDKPLIIEVNKKKLTEEKKKEKKEKEELEKLKNWIA